MLHTVPQYDPSARYLATARIPVFAGREYLDGEALPSPPEDPREAMRFHRTMRQLFELRRVTKIKALKKKEKEKLNGRPVH